MASTYTANLKLELIPTGAQSGIWGATTNVNLGSSTATQSGLEQAIVGKATLPTGDFAANVATYTLTDSNAYQVARAFVLDVTATLTGAGTINVPAIQKPYLVFNNSVGGFAITVKVSGQTGVSIPNGSKAWLYNNGTDVGAAFNYAPSLTLGTPLTPANGGTGGNLTTNFGGTGNTTYTAGDLSYYASGTTFTRIPIGSSTFLLTSSGTAPQWTNPTSVTVGTATTATNIAGGAANRVVFQSGASTTSFVTAPVTVGTVLGWTGTVFDWVTAPSSTSAVNLAGGTAGVVPFQSGVGATSFTAVGTSNYLLTSAGVGTPTWTNPASLSVSSAATATNVAGGIASQILYQSAAGTTAFIPNGVAGQLLKSNGTAVPTWVDSSTVSTSNGKLYFFGQF